MADPELIKFDLIVCCFILTYITTAHQQMLSTVIVVN